MDAAQTGELPLCTGATAGVSSAEASISVPLMAGSVSSSDEGSQVLMRWTSRCCHSLFNIYKLKGSTDHKAGVAYGQLVRGVHVVREHHALHNTETRQRARESHTLPHLQHFRQLCDK